MKTLYNIKEDYSELMRTLEENEGELTDELNEALTINQSELESKSIGYLSIITQKEEFSNSLDNEIKRLQAIKKQNDRSITFLKDRLLNAVLTFGNFEVGFTKFGTRKSQQVIVEDVNSLPTDYKVRKVTETADKTKLKAAIKGGEQIAGVELKSCLSLKIN